MKKNGTTKTVSKSTAKTKTKKKPTGDTATPTPTPKTGDKRQLPLDFSRHALNAHSKKTSEDATNKEDPLEQWRTPSTLTPTVIRVNLVPKSTSCSAVLAPLLEEDLCIAENELEQETEGQKLQRVDPDQDVAYQGCDDDMAPSTRTEHSSENGDDEDPDAVDTAIVSVKPEPDDSPLDSNGMVIVKTEDTKDFDMLLPIQYRWKTVYVAAFELALDTVLPEEAFLFTDEELALFEAYRELEDDPKHLFVRLYLRNQKYWFRLSKLDGRYREIEDLPSAIHRLVSVGLLMDQNQLEVPEEALAMLTIDELKLLARRVGIKEKLTGKQRIILLETILAHFRQQSFISKRLLLAPGGAADGEGESRKTGLATHIFSGDTVKRDGALIGKIVDLSGPCVKIYTNVMKVFERMHLVFHRTKGYSEKPALQEAILAKIGRRNFPTYEITRTNTVFRNRDELLKYEEAIRMHHELTEMIESASGPAREAVVYVRDNDERTEPRKAINTKVSSNGGGNSDPPPVDPTEERRIQVVAIHEKVIEEAEKIREPWRGYISTEMELSAKNPNYFLLHFSPGWVYTQILRLELRALAFLKRFEQESILLHELLDQHIYSLGQRGSWYDRLALIRSNYSFQKRLGKQEALQVCMMGLRDKHVHAVDATSLQARIVRLETELKVPFKDRHDFSYLALRTAQKRILTGERLNTPGTAAPSYASSHSYSYVPSSGTSLGSGHPVPLQQRPLWRNIDGSDCGVEELALSYYGTLGYKGFHSENTILTTLFSLLFWDILFSPQPGVFETSYQTEPLDLRTDAFFLTRQDMIIERVDSIAKSKLPLDECPALSVSDCNTVMEGGDQDEPLVSRRRTRNGTMESAFESSALFADDGEAQKTAPTDPDSDTKVEGPLSKKRRECFYLNLLQTTDDRYREKKVFCVGVNWSFSKEDLLEIAECIGGHALSEICKLLAQEYRQRCSGMPDLCCWNYEKKQVKFVEVKGPGDRLSTKQQVWIDLLTSLNVDIELCIVQVSKAEEEFLEERASYN